MWETTADGIFTGGTWCYYGLWTRILARSNSLNDVLMDFFLTDMQLLKTLTDGLEWCGLLVDYCDVFISCLDSHSDGTHSLQSIHCWDTDAVTHFSKSDEETNSSSSWMDWGWVYFQLIFIFGWTIPLMAQIKSLCDILVCRNGCFVFWTNF